MVAQAQPTELSLGRAPTLEDIERLEAVLLRRDDKIELPLHHTFAPGVYVREIFMPAGSFALGHKHKTEHVNIVVCGRAKVFMDGKVHEIVGPCTFVSKPGVRKALLILEDMIWGTVHPTKETDLAKLKAELIEESDAFLEYSKELELLRANLADQPALV